MPQNRAARKLLGKADQDLVALAKWRSDPDIAHEIAGFHAQQAAEKMLKAVLAHHGVEFPFSHRLADLIDLMRDSGIAVPGRFEGIRYLTPFAVSFRCDFYEEDEDPLDLDAMYGLLTDLRAWAEGALSA